jgi:hypothetical protein
MTEQIGGREIRSLADATRRQDGRACVKRTHEAWTQQTAEHLTIRSVSEGYPCVKRTSQAWTQQTADHLTIRSVSDGSAWGWGPTRTK